MTATADTKTIAEAWRARADELATFYFEHFVQRTDAWGGYKDPRHRKPDGSDKTLTHKGILSKSILVAHFSGHRHGNVIGLHPIATDNTCSWFTIEIDNHLGKLELAEVNRAGALAIDNHLLELGLIPRTWKSDGKGGFHIDVILNGRLPSKVVYQFARSITAKFEEFQLPTRPETFPKQDGLREDRPYGNWVRIPGLHHTHPHWSEYWDGTEFIDGDEAIEWLLSTPESDASIIERLVAELPPDEPAQAESPTTSPADSVWKDRAKDVAAALAARPRNSAGADPIVRCRAYLNELPNSVSGDRGHDKVLQAACETFRFGLSDSDAWQLLEEYNMDRCEPAWSTKELQHKFEEAKRLTKADFGKRLNEDAPPKKTPSTSSSSTNTEQPNNVTPASQTPEQIFLDPIPLDSFDPPKFPTGVFTGWLADFILGVAAETETPIDLPATAALSMLSIAAQRKASVRTEQNHFEQLSFYGAVFLDSGARKTGVLKRFQSPLVNWEKQTHAAMEPERHKLEMLRGLSEQRIKAIEKEVDKGKKTPDEAVIEISQLRADMPEIPAWPRLFTSESTPEKLAALLAEQDERMAVISDEAGFFEVLAGRYAKTGSDPNLDIVLQSYSGSCVRIDRSSRETIVLNHPALAIFLSPQPSIAQKMVAQPGFRSRGLLARFCFSLPKSGLGSRSHTPKPIDDKVVRTYEHYMHQLLDVPLPAINPKVLQLHPDAYDSWKAYQRSIEASMAPGGMLEQLTDVGGRWPGTIARLAGLLHIADYGASAFDHTTITQEVMLRAQELGDHFLTHGVRVLGSMGADPGIVIARKLWSAIVDSKKQLITARDIFRIVQGSYGKMEDIEPGLKTLSERAWLIEIGDERQSRPGRPSRAFKVNPKAVGFVNIVNNP